MAAENPVADLVADQATKTATQTFVKGALAVGGVVVVLIVLYFAYPQLSGIFAFQKQVEDNASDISDIKKDVEERVSQAVQYRQQNDEKVRVIGGNQEDLLKSVAALEEWRTEHEQSQLEEDRKDLQNENNISRLQEDVQALKKVVSLVEGLEDRVDKMEEDLQDLRDDLGRTNQNVLKNTDFRNIQVVRANRRQKDHNVRDGKITFLLGESLSIRTTLVAIRDYLIKDGASIPYGYPNPISISKESGGLIENE